jgi:hypothetical protein
MTIFYMYREACELPMSFDYSRFLFYSSFSLGVSSMVSVYFQDYSNSFMMFLLFLTSIQYWYRPDYGLRRNIDMTLCKLMVFYYYLTILYDREEFYSTTYLCMALQLIYLYILEIFLVTRLSPKWIIFHMAMHIQMSVMIPFLLYVL